MVREAAYKDMHRGQNTSKNFITIKLGLGRYRNMENIIQWYLSRKISNEFVYGNKVQFVIEQHYFDHVIKKKLSLYELKRITVFPIPTDEGSSHLNFIVNTFWSV